MKIKHILLCSNNNPKYYSFWPSVSYHWHSMGYKVHLAFVSNLNENDNLIKNLKKYGDNVFLFKPNNNNIIIQSKLARFYISKFFKDDIVCLSDIDYYSLINHENAENITTQEVIDGKKIATLGFNAYINYKSLNKPQDIKNNVFRFPAFPTISKGHKIYELFCDNLNLDFLNFLEYIQNKTNLNLKNVVSDEELLLNLNTKRPKWVKNNIIFNIRDDYIDNNNYYCMTAQKRIDRSNNCRFDINKFKKKYYIDVFPNRPYNKKNIEYILDYLKIPKEIQNINL